MMFTKSHFTLYTTLCLIFLFQPTKTEIELSDEQKEMQLKAGIQCLETHMNDTLPSEDDIFCPWTWDTWGCWSNTQPGDTAFIHCPAFVPGMDPNKLAHKECLPDGTWFIHPETNLIWSNYSGCEVDSILPPGGFAIYYAGYGLTIITCGISLFIFFYFRNLGCPRVTIHKNLFLSFILDAICWVVTMAVVTLYPDITGVSCRLLHILIQYFSCCNYFWMLCEGVYLFYLLVISVFSEDKKIYLFYLLGWAAPLIPVSIYFIMMMVTAPDECWLGGFSDYAWIVIGSLIGVLVVNLGIIIAILIVLVIKLKDQPSTGSNSAIEAVKKAIRATFILLPLLGLHQIFTAPPAPPTTPWREIYLSIGAIFTSFQGFFVSCLFCFFNGEVKETVCRCFTNYINTHNLCPRRSSRSSSSQVRNQFRRRYRTFANKRSLSQRGSSRKHMMYTVTTEINEDTPEHRRKLFQLANGTAESNGKTYTCVQTPTAVMTASMPDCNQNGGGGCVKPNGGASTRTILNSQLREAYGARVPLTLHDASRKRSESFL